MPNVVKLGTKSQIPTSLYSLLVEFTVLYFVKLVYILKLFCNRKFRLELEKVLEHIVFRLVTVILVLMDVTFVIIDLISEEDILELEIMSLIIVSYFMVEIGARMFVYG